MGKARWKAYAAGFMAFSVLMSGFPVYAGDVKNEAEKQTVITEEQLAGNDYVLYLANCGTPDASVVPEGYRKGLCQSQVDQEYQEDAQTGMEWGYAAADANSELVKGGANAQDITGSYAYMSEYVTFDAAKSGLRYSFELPQTENQDYEVTVGTKNPWSARDVDIMLEEQTVEEHLNLKQDVLVEKSYKVTVEDGELNVMVHSPYRTSQYADPIVSYIIVKAVPAYNLEMLSEALTQMDAAMVGKNYGTESMEVFTAARKDADELIKNQSQDMAAVSSAYWRLREAFGGLKEISIYDSITGVAGAPMYDNNGEQIQAHGGQIQQLTVNGTTKYYWIGEDKTNDYRPVGGIHLYTSEDLYNWKDEGVVLKTMETMEEFETDPYFKDLYGDYTQEKKEEIFIDLDKNNCVIERPKMIYNEKTGKYVIWFHADGRTPENQADYGKAKAGIAIADHPEGPYKLLGSYKLSYSTAEGEDYGYDGWEGRGSVRDMNLFVDDDGSAYVIYSSNGNKTTFIARLNDEYTDLAAPPDEAVEGVHFTRNFINWSREAPAMFQYQDKYYMVTSGCTGWSPNPAQYAVADSPMGPWTAMGDPCSGEESSTTYRTQSTCVFPVDAENGKFIYMGDRWVADDLSESRYVWLPVEFLDGDKIAINRYENWKLEELNNKGKFSIQTQLPKAAVSLEELNGKLPTAVDLLWGGEQIKGTPVTWEVPAQNFGPVSVRGTLNDYNRNFTQDVYLYDQNMMYLFDCGRIKSEFVDTVREQGGKLKNTQCDQVYSKEDKAGYLSIPGGSEAEEATMGSHEGTGSYENGWWAKSGKSIDYAFDLKAGTYTVYTGYQEWWNTSRQISVSVKNDKGIRIAENSFKLEASDKERVEKLDFALEEDATVTVSVGRAGGNADPVLSFIGVSQNSRKKPDTDKSKLISLYEAAKNIIKGNHTDASWNVFDAARQEAKIIIENEYAEQKEIDDAYAALEGAQRNLKQKEPVPAVVPVKSVTLNSTGMKLLKGQSFRLRAQVAPANATDKRIAFSSRNSSVAVVSADGTVTAKKSGQTVITATAVNGIRAEFKVTVQEKPVSLKLNVKKRVLGAGETFRLLAQVSPKYVTDSKVTFKSKDKSVATVSSSGKVKARKQGSTIITASTSNGKKVTCKITVKKAPTSIRLNAVSKTLKVNKTFQIVKRLSSKSAGSVTYSSSNKKVASVSESGKIKALRKGKTTITVRTYNKKKACMEIRVR